MTPPEPGAAEPALRWIEQHGEPPAAALTRLMRDHRVVVVGERRSDNPHRRRGAEYILSLAEGGATHLAVEADVRDQGRIDTFMRTGDVSLLPWWMQVDAWLANLHAARAAGLRVMAVDGRAGDDGQIRDVAMAWGISSLLARDRDARVVGWFGQLHVATLFDAEGNAIPHSSVPALLRADGRTRVASVGATFDEDSPLRNLAAPGSAPVLVPTRGSPLAGIGMDRYIFGPEVTGGSFDYVILYP